MPTQKKKILFLSTKSVLGGAQRYIVDLVDYLPKDSYECVVAAGGTGAFSAKIVDRKIPYHSIKNFTRDINFITDIKAFFEILKLIKKIKPDILHLNSSKASFLGAIAGTLAGVPKIISSTHGWPFLENRPRWQRKFLRALTRFESRFANTIICVSEFDYATGVKERIAPAKKLVQIHNGIDASRHLFLEKSLAQEKLFSKAGVPQKNYFVVGSIAEYTKNKGLLYLIEAAAHIITIEPRALFLLVGWGEEKKFLEDQIAYRQLTNHVFLIDYLPEAFTYLKAFDVFILPSNKEGFAYTLLEASLAELPIITTRVGGNPEIIENLKNGLLIRPGSPEEIINSISHLLKDASDRVALGQEARKKVMRDFSITSMIALTEAAYRR
ncbi:MAG: glycosyltransferase family 4 protein [Patescibacteria group bacterium]